MCKFHLSFLKKERFSTTITTNTTTTLCFASDEEIVARI